MKKKVLTIGILMGSIGISFGQIDSPLGTGFRLWGMDDYKMILVDCEPEITHQYSSVSFGPVNSWAIKMTTKKPEHSKIATGWVWGVNDPKVAPVAALSVFGNMRIKRSFIAGGRIGAGMSNHTYPTEMLDVRGTIKSKTGWADWVKLETTTGDFWRIHNPEDQDYLIFGWENSSATKQTYSLRLHQDGSASIGTSKHIGALLSVAGIVRAEEVEVSLKATWPDFVFADDYKLQPITEVEEFIIQNKHLPNVPSEKEIKQDGINLGEMDAILLQKIEELTLHMIQLNKRLEKVEKENKALQR